MRQAFHFSYCPMETIQRASTSRYDVSLKFEDYLNLYPKAQTIQCNNTTTTRHTMPPSDSTTESPAAGPLHYRWIAQDHGGTYKHTTTDPPPPGPKDALDLLNLPAIGTWQCRTCVGVYMQISQHPASSPTSTPRTCVPTGTTQNIPPTTPPTAS